MADRLLLTCEHGGNRVPRRWRGVFRGARAVLDSHRGWDPGALAVARALARRLGVPLLATGTTRLLADGNRSAGHRALFSEFTAPLPREERERILEEEWRPHRAAVERTVATLIAGGHRVVHVAVHSFTPALGGVERTADVAFLYDPRRRGEREICGAWLRALATADPGLRLRRNYPYFGRADGLATALRRRFAARAYLGIELEMNQALVGAAGPGRRRVASALLATLGGAKGWTGR